jgi:hypothetical protein
MPVGLGAAFLANLVWVNLSEVARYFLLVMPMMRDAFGMVPDIAPMNLAVFMIWGVWDLIVIMAITGFSWLMLDRMGRSIGVAILAGTLVWLAIFVVLWLGLYNMNLATPWIVIAALPLAWVEMVVAALIVRYFIAQEEVAVPRLRT